MECGWLVMVAMLGAAGVGGAPQGGSGPPAPTSQCPPAQEINPCQCQVKKNGLDVMCEFTDMFHITKALTVLKGRPNVVVFYLKLRHNNMPKLQSFVFLGIEIRHLTVHNSSLAVVEESSLSSTERHKAIDQSQCKESQSKSAGEAIGPTEGDDYVRINADKMYFAGLQN
ncbi:hypothetical protein AAG570_000859 [Ranatra chinensis]|uniref:Uncharacterized protein n=1 Tax=Ranatra chinensis TaxID=642074 RepID=A0ABD0YYY6_9HEMI